MKRISVMAPHNGWLMLKIDDIHAGYGEFEVLRGVSLEVGAGEVVALLGSNGVGKTTLNRVLSGLLKPSAGTVHFDGREITGIDHAEIVSRGLIHVPEGRKIFPNLSVWDNLLLGAYLRGRTRKFGSLERVMTVFPRLRERRKQLGGSLSGGEQQMLAIGRALMSEPRLLILDEPSLGLSPLLTEELFGLIQQLRGDGLSILLVEQNVLQSLMVASRAYVMELGRIVISGASSDLLEAPRLKTAYLGF